MTHPIFQLEGYTKLPLWAQVLLATRLLRRAVLRLPGDCAPAVRQALEHTCDVLERCATTGDISAADAAALERAVHTEPTTDAMAAMTSTHYAADAALAAQASLDFSAAEAACTRSVGQAIAWASEADGMTPLQARIYLAADLDLLTFACSEARVGTYDGLTTQVLSRLIPIN